MAERNIGLRVSLPEFDKLETVSAEGRDVRLFDTVEHVHMKVVHQPDCPEHTPYKQSKLDIIIKEICKEEFLLDCSTEKCTVDFTNVVSLPKPVGNMYCGNLQTQQDPGTCAPNDLNNGTYISSFCASVPSSQNFLQKCHSKDAIPLTRHPEPGPTISVVQPKIGNSDMPVLGKCNDKVTEISFGNATSESNITSHLSQVTSQSITSSICLSNQPSGYVTSNNKFFSGRPRSCFSTIANLQHASQKDISDQGYSSVSTGSSCQGTDSQREESVMDHESLEPEQASLFPCNCNSDLPADQGTCVKTYLHGDNELDDLLYHFEIFFQNRFDSELRHFQENVFAIMQEQQSHVRHIVHAAIMEHRSQSCCAAADDVQHTVNIESKPDHTTSMPVVGTSHIPETDVVHLSSLAQIPHCNRSHQESVKIQRLLDLMTLSCSVSTLLAKSQFRS